MKVDRNFEDLSATKKLLQRLIDSWDCDDERSKWDCLEKDWRNVIINSFFFGQEVRHHGRTKIVFDFVRSRFERGQLIFLLLLEGENEEVVNPLELEGIGSTEDYRLND